jgi:multimeric flavodoxin WrbA
MNVVAITGSPRKNGNTEILTRHALQAIEEEGLDTELVSLAEIEIKPCTACGVCKKEERCSIEDELWPVYLRMKQSDAIILASPVYYGSATAQMKAFMDRAGYIGHWNGRVFEGKVGGSLVVARRAGKNFTFAQLNFWFQNVGCFTPGSSYWNVAFGDFDKGTVEVDEEGMQTAWNFGKNIAFLVKRLKS